MSARDAGTPFSAWCAAPSPLTAIRLAIEDHKASHADASAAIDWQYLAMLRDAATLIEAAGELARHSPRLVDQCLGELSLKSAEFAGPIITEVARIWREEARR